MVKRRKVIIAECYKFGNRSYLWPTNDIDLIGGSSQNSIPIKIIKGHCCLGIETITTQH